MLRYLWFAAKGTGMVILSVYRRSEACLCPGEGIALLLSMGEAGGGRRGFREDGMSISGCGGTLLMLLLSHYRCL